MTDPFATASQMLAALQRREISSLELTELHIDRINRLDPKINAVVVRDFEHARERAMQADAERAAGTASGALHGLPHTLKESTMAAGLPQTAAIPEFAGNVATEDGPVAARVRAAGGVLLGKTNIPPFLADIQSNNETYGRTLNPWDPTRSPGGSTGGGAAAVASGLSPLEFGSDIGGSIRIPSLFCGIYGHRPSETAVTRSGAIPPASRPNITRVMGVQGPLARSAEDLELALDVIAAPEAGEDVAWKLAIPPARHERLAGFRVAVLPSLDWCPVDNELLAAQETAVAALSKLGAKVAIAAPDFDLHEHHRVYMAVLGALMSARLTPEQRAEAGQGPAPTLGEFIEWMDRRERYREAYRAFFRDWDILLCPTTTMSAFEHDDRPMAQRTIVLNGNKVPFGGFLAYSGWTTLSGQPSTAFPMGLNTHGLPVGLQAIGPYLEDRTPIRFASLITKECGGYQRPPGFE
jgi:amidase